MVGSPGSAENISKDIKDILLNAKLMKCEEGELFVLVSIVGSRGSIKNCMKFATPFLVLIFHQHLVLMKLLIISVSRLVCNTFAKIK